MPSRARAILLESGALSVLEQLAIAGVGDPALQAPDRLQGLLALGSLASLVDPAVGVEADLTDRGDVEHVFIRRRGRW